jgi:biopolymer transport protein ExbD
MRIFEMSARHRQPSIRMINLVDVLLNLLIFFIASTTFKVATNQPNAVKLSLPEAKTGEELGKQKTEELKIVVTAEGAVYINNKRVALNVLEKTLAEVKAQNPAAVLELSADKSVSYGTVVAVVDAARAAGIRNITAFTKKSAQ